MKRLMLGLFVAFAMCGDAAAQDWIRYYPSAGMPTSGGPFTGPILLSNGDCFNPSWGFAGDDDGTGTGMARTAANQPSICIDGVESYRITASLFSLLNNSATIRLGSAADISIGRRAAATPVVNLGGVAYAATQGSSITLTGIHCVNTTAQATTGTVEEVLATCTLPANAMSANGKGVRITAWGSLAANGNSKTLNLRFGGLSGTIIAAWTSTGNASGWNLFSTVIRTGAATQVAFGNGYGFNLAPRTTDAAPTQTLSGAVDIVVTGTTATASGDATFKGLIVEFLN